MSVATQTAGEQLDTRTSDRNEVNDAVEEDSRVHRMGQMGAQRIGQVAIGLVAIGITLNKMSQVGAVNNSTGVIDVNGIIQTAGGGLELMTIVIIVIAAAAIMSVWG